MIESLEREIDNLDKEIGALESANLTDEYYFLLLKEREVKISELSYCIENNIGG
jgi:hypothetical protein